MKTLAWRDLGDPGGVLRVYSGLLADLPGQPAHVRRRMAALRDLRGLGNARVLLVSGRRFRSIGVRNPHGICYGLTQREVPGCGYLRLVFEVLP